MLYLSVMNLIARPWLIAVLLGLLALSPAHAGMTPQEVEVFKDAKAWAEKGEAEGQLNLGICYTKGEGGQGRRASGGVVSQGRGAGVCPGPNPTGASLL